MTNGQCLPVDTSPCYRTLPIRLLPAKLSRMKLTKKKLPSIIPSDAGTGLVAHNLLLRLSTSPPAVMMQTWISGSSVQLKLLPHRQFLVIDDSHEATIYSKRVAHPG
jgi:hypothetical protein